MRQRMNLEHFPFHKSGCALVLSHVGNGATPARAEARSAFRERLLDDEMAGFAVISFDEASLEQKLPGVDE
jgi:hypothetical protein